MQPLLVVKTPIEPEQADQLKTLFASPGFSTLRDIITAQCMEQQAVFMNMTLYENENAENQALIAKLKAMEYNHALDVLDRLQQFEQEWFRIKLEQR